MLRGFKWTVLPLAAALCAFGQTKHTRIEVLRYTIDADLNPRTQTISSTVKIEFTPLESGSDVSFELNNALTVMKAVDGQGQTLSSSRNTADFTVTVTYPKGLQKGQPTQLSLSYDGKL